jgi:putative ABC transport system ATP-binding protein
MSLRAENVSLLLGDGDTQVRALDDVSVAVAAGELTMVLGPSGAGKSSLLAVCGGLRTPSSGRIWIGDEEITALKPARLAELRRQQIGFVFQQSNLLPSLTALDQLLLLVHLSGRRPSAKDRKRAEQLLEEVGMAEKLHRRSGQLSGGERQRVGIARAFMSDPAVLLVDEPTSMLDRQRGHQIAELLQRACHEHQVAAMMVTHDRGVLDTVDRVVEILDGRLTQTTVAQVNADEATADAAH